MPAIQYVPRPLKLGDKVIFKLHDYSTYMNSIKRNVWHEVTVDFIYKDGVVSIQFYHHMFNVTLLKYICPSTPLIGRVTVIRKVEK